VESAAVGVVGDIGQKGLEVRDQLLGQPVAGLDIEAALVRMPEGDEAGLAGEHLRGCLQDHTQEFVQIQLRGERAADLQQGDLVVGRGSRSA